MSWYAFFEKKIVGGGTSIPDWRVHIYLVTNNRVPNLSTIRKFLTCTKKYNALEPVAIIMKT